jgi:hypothetical protein
MHKGCVEFARRAGGGVRFTILPVTLLTTSAAILAALAAAKATSATSSALARAACLATSSLDTRAASSSSSFLCHTHTTWREGGEKGGVMRNRYATDARRTNQPAT